MDYKSKQADIHACSLGTEPVQTRCEVYRSQDTGILPLTLWVLRIRIFPGIFSHRPFQTFHSYLQCIDNKSYTGVFGTCTLLHFY